MFVVCFFSGCLVVLFGLHRRWSPLFFVFCVPQKCVSAIFVSSNKRGVGRVVVNLELWSFYDETCMTEIRSLSRCRCLAHRFEMGLQQAHFQHQNTINMEIGMYRILLGDADSGKRLAN